MQKFYKIEILFICGIICEFIFASMDILGVAPSNLFWLSYVLLSVKNFRSLPKEKLLIASIFAILLPLIAISLSFFYHDQASSVLLVKDKLKYSLAFTAALMFGLTASNFGLLAKSVVLVGLVTSLVSIGQKLNIPVFYQLHAFLNGEDAAILAAKGRPAGLAQYYLPLSYQLSISYLLLQFKEVLPNRTKSWAVVAIIIVSGIIFAETRSAWLGLLISLSFMTFKNGFRSRSFLLLAILGLGVFAKINLNPDRFKMLFQGFQSQTTLEAKNEDFNILARKWMLRTGYAVLKRNPIVGVGRSGESYAKQIDSVEADIQIPSDMREHLKQNLTHNAFLNHALSEGLPLTILALAFVFYFLFISIPHPNFSVQIFLSICLAFIVNGVFHNSGLHNYALALVAFGLLVAKMKQPLTEKSQD